MVLLEEIAMITAQVTLVGYVNRPETVFGYPEEEKPELGEIVKG
jgi:hypothetical protein